MTKLVFNNNKNPSINHTLFKFNCSYYFWILYKKNVNLCSKSKSADKLLAKLRELMIICKKNLYYTLKLQKRVYNKGVKPQNFIFGNKI